MQIQSLKNEDVPLVYDFLRCNGWRHRLGSSDEFVRLIAASQRCCIAKNPTGEIVGFARAISDGMSNGYLSMVAVEPSLRRQGIGRALVQDIIGTNPDITWVLRAGRDGAAEFFAALGFEASSVAMEKRRSTLSQFLANRRSSQA